ncbi:MAG: MFS transporter [Emcibacteraceae bacterium]|nr:MFS transporter [Emcibacteraceae bacterium]MDG1857815.1 MFS transporter [Emcibacteraceae bacterium]
MTSDSEVMGDTSNPFDKWQSIAVAVFMALVGYAVMVSVPVLSTALVAKVGFTEAEVGRIWGADMGGFSAGAILSALLVSKFNRRYLVVGGVILAVVANALCMQLVSFDQVLALRAMAGVGSGLLTGIAVATLGGATNPVKAYNFEMFGFAISTALLLHFLPQLTMNGIYILFIILTSLCALFVRWIPSRPQTAEELARQDRNKKDEKFWMPPKFLPILCLVAVCFTYINIGGYYTYIELAALADGVLAEWATPVLTWSSVFGVLGCVVAYFATRFGIFKPLYTALILMSLAVYMVSNGIGNINFLISIFAFMALWTFADVYQSAMVAHMDRTGSFVALLPAVQGFGQFLGPNIAASILDAEYGYSTMFIVSGSMTMIALALYMTVGALNKKLNPANA